MWNMSSGEKEDEIHLQQGRKTNTSFSKNSGSDNEVKTRYNDYYDKYDEKLGEIEEHAGKYKLLKMINLT